MTPYGAFTAVSLLEYGGLKPILPFLGGRSGAARRVVVKRIREEHFNHALPVLVVMRFLWGGLCGIFLPLAGVCGRRGFWAWACARDSRYARERAGALGGRSASRAKAPGTFARGELSFPPFFGDPKKGGAGAAGARSPRDERGLLGVLRYDRGKTYMNDAALLERTLAGGRALAPLGTAPTENIMSNPVMVRNVMPF